MFRQILPTFFLFLFVCCQLCGQGCVGKEEQTLGNINENTFPEFLKPKDENLNEVIKKAHEEDERNDDINEIKIESVFLAAANGVVIALAEVSYSVKDKKKFIIVEKFIETDKEKWKNEEIGNGGADWKTQLVTKNEKNIKDTKFKNSVVVGNGNKVYYFSLNNSKFVNGAGAVAAQTEELHITVLVGEVADQEKKITWNLWDSKNIYKGNIKLNEKLKTDLGTTFPTVGFCFVIEDKIVFAIQGEAKDQKENKYVIVFCQLDEREVKELYVEPSGNCYFSLFLWEKQIVMIPTVCSNSDKSNQKIKAFDYKQKQFNDSYRSFARLQEFLKDKKNFVTAKIDKTTDVLLFTQQSKNTSNGKYEVYLWVTDGNRAAKVDIIITETKDTFDLSILYTNNDLFVLYNNYGTGGTTDFTEEKSTYNLKRLPNQLEKIKLILGAWKNADNKIKDFFKDTTAQTPSFTDRLVGFLSSDSQDNEQWKDEYFYENTTIANGTKDSGGFKFSGAKTGAKWLVGKSKKEDQPYNFTDPGFTLVATVKIDKDTNDKWNSILGVVLRGTNDKTIGLWCSGGKWSVSDGKNTAAKFTTETCVQGEKYQVVLTMGGNKFSMYIDGKLAKGFSNNPIVVQEEEKDITHFYFGVDNAVQNTQSTNIESHVTVTNVLLYNRPFEERDISNLKECEKTPKVIKNPKEDHGTTAKENEQTSNVPTISDEKEDEKVSSPSRTGDGGVGGGVRVFSLLLAVLCVSAPLLHL